MIFQKTLPLKKGQIHLQKSSLTSQFGSFSGFGQNCAFGASKMYILLLLEISRVISPPSTLCFFITLHLTLFRFVCQMQVCFGGRLASTQWLCYPIEKTWSQNQSPKKSSLRSQLQKVMKREKCQVFHLQGLLDCEHNSRSRKINISVFWLQLLVKFGLMSKKWLLTRPSLAEPRFSSS